VSGSPAGVAAASASGFDVEFIDGSAGRHRGPLASCWSSPFERAVPVRSFPSLKGRANYPGLWWAATTGAHVGFESWAERDVAMMLDFDPQVTAFSSQPFWLRWHDGRRIRRHAPDFFARRADGTGLVVDVRPDGLVDEVAAESFAAMAAACAGAGWEFRRTGGPLPVLAANVRWLSGYRHPRCLRPAVTKALSGVLREPGPLLAAAEAAGDPVAVLPVIYHLMWRHVITADLETAPLGPETVIAAAGGSGL
jgi:hypothetical protein